MERSRKVFDWLKSVGARLRLKRSAFDFPASTESQAPGERLGKLAVAVSMLSGAVSVAAFALSSFAAFSGPDVTMFPPDSIMFYQNPDNDRLSMSVRTEFTNTAGPDQPDALVEHWVEILVDDEPFACFGDRGSATFRVADAADDDPQSCDVESCMSLRDGATLSLEDGPRRHAILAGQITSLDRYFDARAITRNHPCHGVIEERPTVTQFVGDGGPREAVVVYHATLLREGSFTSRCRLRLEPAQLTKLLQTGWANYGCEEVR